MNGHEKRPGADRNRDAELVRAARRAMERSDEQLDGETLSRLRRIRAQALEAEQKTAQLWWPAGSALAAALLVALLWPQSRTPAPEPQLFAADSWLLETDADLEMIGEADFYLWLAADETNET